MENNNREKINDEQETKEEDVENTLNANEGNEKVEKKSILELKREIVSKIADLRELQHESSPHKKFDLIQNWMGQPKDFSLYEDATNEQREEILELMGNLKGFVEEYARVLYSERGKVQNVTTYIK